MLRSAEFGFDFLLLINTNKRAIPPDVRSFLIAHGFAHRLEPMKHSIAVPHAKFIFECRGGFHHLMPSASHPISIIRVQMILSLLLLGIRSTLVFENASLQSCVIKEPLIDSKDVPICRRRPCPNWNSVES